MSFKITLKRIHCIITFLFYIVLLIIIFHSLSYLLNASTTFEEYEVEMDAKLPGFTFCPYHQQEPDNILESFEDIIEAVKDASTKYSIELYLIKPFQKM